LIDVRRREDLYHHQREWLETEWHFSFGEYRDPDNDRFGALRVLNNDRIDPGGRFPMHSHDNMEIITWVIQGEIRHEDSTGTRKTVSKNGVQKMSAGSGISHSELNPSNREPLHLVQIWIEPSKFGIEPGYQDHQFSESELSNNLVTVASGQTNSGDVVTIEQDARVLVGHPETDTRLDCEFEWDGRAYVVVMDGEVSVSGESLKRGDAARIRDQDGVSVQAEADARVLIVDLT